MQWHLVRPFRTKQDETVQTKDTYRQFAVVLEDADDKVAIHVFGDVDLSCASSLEAAIDEAASAGLPVVVNFQQCQYMDSTGLNALARAVNRYGHRFGAVVTDDSAIARLIRIANFEMVLPITFSKRARHMRAV